MGRAIKKIYADNTGGTNLRSNPARINQSDERTDFRLIQNMDTYKDGGFRTQRGNEQINTSVTDETSILGIGRYRFNGVWYAIYTKASGKAYVMQAAGGTETEIKTGLNTSAIPQFVEFNQKVLCFNGEDAPWSWDGTTAADLTDTPAAWSSSQPYTAGVYRGGRVFAGDDNTTYYCALGNENDWTTNNDAGSLTNLFSDNSSITGIVDYSSALALFSARPRIYLLAGTSPSDYAVDPKASDRSLVGKLAWAKTADFLYFYTGDAIIPLITTELGVIKVNREVELTQKIAPFITAKETKNIVSPVDKTKDDEVILLNNSLYNELVAYFTTTGNTAKDTAAMFSFSTGAWVFRKATAVTAACMINGNVITGTADGKILKEFSGLSVVNGASFQKRLLSPYFHFDNPTTEKELQTMWFWFKSTNAINLTLKLYADYDDETVIKTHTISLAGDSSSCIYNEGAYNVDTYGGEVVQFDQFSLDASFRTLSFEILSTNDQDDFELLSYGFEVDELDAN